MRQSPDTRSPSGKFHHGAAGRLECALDEIANVAELLAALAATAVQFDPRAVYPAADTLRQAHRDAAAALEQMTQARAEVAA